MIYYLITTIWLQNFQSHYGSWSKLAPTSAAMDESPNPLPPCSPIKLLHALSCNIVTLSVFIVVYSICFNNAYICTYIYIYMHILDNCCIRFHCQQKTSSCSKNASFWVNPPWSHSSPVARHSLAWICLPASARWVDHLIFPVLRRSTMSKLNHLPPANHL